MPGTTPTLTSGSVDAVAEVNGLHAVIINAMLRLVSRAPAACRLPAVAARNRLRRHLNGTAILARGSLIMLLAWVLGRPATPGAAFADDTDRFPNTTNAAEYPKDELMTGEAAERRTDSRGGARGD